MGDARFRSGGQPDWLARTALAPLWEYQADCCLQRLKGQGRLAWLGRRGFEAKAGLAEERVDEAGPALDGPEPAADHGEPVGVPRCTAASSWLRWVLRLSQTRTTGAFRARCRVKRVASPYTTRGARR
jgi:hypothetical protein